MLTEEKMIKLRWPSRLWLAMVNKAKREETSLQTLITEAVLDKYGVEHWRVVNGDKKNAHIKYALSYLPMSISLKQSVIDAKMQLGLELTDEEMAEYLKG